MKSLKKYTILYAEDETIIRLSISKTLKKYCDKVLLAKNGKEALEIYLAQKPDILILDVNMPFLSGLDLCKKVRERNKDIPIILLTAYTQTNLLLDAIELNLCKYLVKPVSKVALKEALENVWNTLNKNNKDIIHLSDEYSWDNKDKKLLHDNTQVTLTTRESTLLNLLIGHHRQTVSHEEIMAIAWEDKFMEEISIDSVKSLINSLRKKIPKKLINSVYGKGYILNKV